MSRSSPKAFDFFLDLFDEEHLSKLNRLGGLSEDHLEKIIKRFKKDVPRYSSMKQEDLILYFTDKERFDRLMSFEKRVKSPRGNYRWNSRSEGTFGNNLHRNRSRTRKSKPNSGRSRNNSRNSARSRSRNRKMPVLNDPENYIGNNLLDLK